MKLYFVFKPSFIFYAFALLCIISCKNNVLTNHEPKTMQQPKITQDDLVKEKPLSIKTDHGYIDMYAVIIYTEDASALRSKGILVQTETSKFVTALIKKDDLVILNTMESVESVHLPQHEYPTTNDLLN